MRTVQKNLKSAGSMEQCNSNMEQIRIAGIRWSLYDQRTWLGEAGDRVYTIKPAVCAWVLEAGGVKEMHPTLKSAKQRALEDHVSRVNQALRIKRWKYEERIGGV